MWIVFDPLDSYHQEFDTQEAAVAHAESLIETYLDDGCWAEGVTDIRVSQLTHVVERRVVAVRSEMGDEAFDELTGDYNGNHEWWEHELVEVTTPDAGHQGDTGTEGGDS